MSPEMNMAAQQWDEQLSCQDVSDSLCLLTCERMLGMRHMIHMLSIVLVMHHFIDLLTKTYHYSAQCSSKIL